MLKKDAPANQYLNVCAAFLILLLLFSCSKNTNKGQADQIAQQVTRKIEKETPKGTRIPEVIGFINSLKVEGSQTVYEYYEHLPFGDSEPNQANPAITAYIAAAILDVERYDEFGTYSVQIRFYFDEKDLLIDYKVWKQGAKV